MHSQDVLDEDRRMSRVQDIVDSAIDCLKSGKLTTEEGRRLIGEVKERVLALFPGKEDVFEIVYRPKLHRVLYGEDR